MAGAKKRRKMKLLTAVYRTSWSTGERRHIYSILTYVTLKTLYATVNALQTYEICLEYIYISVYIYMKKCGI